MKPYIWPKWTAVKVDLFKHLTCLCGYKLTGAVSRGLRAFTRSASSAQKLFGNVLWAGQGVGVGSSIPHVHITQTPRWQAWFKCEIWTSSRAHRASVFKLGRHCLARAHSVKVGCIFSVLSGGGRWRRRTSRRRRSRETERCCKEREPCYLWAVPTPGLKVRWGWRRKWWLPLLRPKSGTASTTTITKTTTRRWAAAQTTAAAPSTWTTVWPACSGCRSSPSLVPTSRSRHITSRTCSATRRWVPTPRPHLRPGTSPPLACPWPRGSPQPRPTAGCSPCPASWLMVTAPMRWTTRPTRTSSHHTRTRRSSAWPCRPARRARSLCPASTNGSPITSATTAMLTPPGR